MPFQHFMIVQRSWVFSKGDWSDLIWSTALVRCQRNLGSNKLNHIIWKRSKESQFLLVTEQRLQRFCEKDILPSISDSCQCYVWQSEIFLSLVFSPTCFAVFDKSREMSMPDWLPPSVATLWPVNGFGALKSWLWANRPLKMSSPGIFGIYGTS